MPQMTGDELARRLRHDEPSVKVLYLTGFSDQLFNEKFTLWQDEAYLDKPCTIEGLLEAVSLLHFDSSTADRRRRTDAATRRACASRGAGPAAAS